MNQDFAEMLAALSEAGAEFLVIGAHAVTFDEAWRRRITVPLWGRGVPVIGREDLIASKRAAGRPRDIADIAELES